MELTKPVPLRSKYNTYTRGDPDWSMTNPLRADGLDFPCKGYHAVLSTTQGTPVAILDGGRTYSWTITGSAIHAGGSCQVSLSVDRGKTFRVLHTYIGSCPAAMGDNTLMFRVPLDVPTYTRALFAWTWFNNLGNREMYMNCASVNLRKGAGTEKYPFLSRPLIFKANVNNKCTTVDSRDVKIPNPGPAVTVKNAKAVAPVGQCGAAPTTKKTSRRSGEGMGPGVASNAGGM